VEVLQASCQIVTSQTRLQALSDERSVNEMAMASSSEIGAAAGAVDAGQLLLPSGFVVVQPILEGYGWRVGRNLQG
jgi:hypothetical protein